MRSLLKSFFIFIFFVLFIANMPMVFSGGKSNPKNDSKKHSDWNYKNANRWDDLNLNYHDCSGKNQSPINITGATDVALPAIEFLYDDKPLMMVNNGHTVKVSYPRGSFINVDGKRFQLLQFHMHAPSENHIEGKSFAMEVHFVHRNNKGELAVVAVMFAEGNKNLELEKIWNYFPNLKEGKLFTSQQWISPKNLLPKEKEYYLFNGSLTTPPCSEGVMWMVMKNSLEISADQLQKFTEMIGENNRPLQPTNDRSILK